MSFSGKMKGVLVTVTGARGSTPRNVGAWLFVTDDAVTGTIGGGQLEYMAIDAVRAGRLGALDIPLGPEIGQCCGGHVTVHLTPADAPPAPRPNPQVLIFGAGHTGRALAAQMQHLPVDLALIDSRASELDQAAVPPGMTRQVALPEAEVRRARPGSAFIILTHDHALDFLIAAEALARHDAAYVGMIGSVTKRARFTSWARVHAPHADAARLVCPIGAGAPDDKRPEVIAAFTATDVLTSLARVPEVVR